MKKQRARTIQTFIPVLCVLLAAVAVLPVRVQADEGQVPAIRKTGTAFAEVAKQATPAVVFIQVEKTIAAGGSPNSYYNDPFEFFFGDEFLRRFFHTPGTPGAPRAPKRGRPWQFKKQGQGSGFLISKDGYILTNSHVVGDADKITVKLHDGREFVAEKIGADPKSEVAVIRIDGEDFPYLEMGDSSALQIGEWVIAIGNPFGLAETLTVGVVSAKGRNGMGIADYENFIQTDAAINPGNSGGPLLDIDGKVVGVNTAIFTRSGGYMGIGFAIPIKMAIDIKDQLVKTGKVSRGFLGIVIQQVTPELAESFGLKSSEGILVADVMGDSAAEKAGLKDGDVILQLNDEKAGSVGEFRNRVAASPPGTSVRLTISRDGKERIITATTRDLEGASPTASDGAELLEKLGLSVHELTEEYAQRHGHEDGEGLVITQVEQGSPAWRSGLKPGDLITAVNRHHVSEVPVLMEHLATAAKSDTVLFRIKDGRYSRYIVLKVE